jgi:uncharacterized membrane protein
MKESGGGGGVGVFTVVVVVAVVVVVVLVSYFFFCLSFLRASRWHDDVKTARAVGDDEEQREFMVGLVFALRAYIT